MGIPSLFKSLIEKYEDIHFWDPEMTYDYLFLDYNNLIHGAKARCFSYSNEKINKIKKMTELQKDKLLIDEVIKYTIEVINTAKPSKLLYIAIDGPVGMSKMKLQRSRRYKTIKRMEHIEELQKKYDINEPELWNSNKITPGTGFIYKLSLELQKVIKNKKFGKNITVILSDANVPGEGEQKIFQYIRDNKLKKIDDKICIYGLDADLIMLSMASNKNNIFLIREPQQSDIEVTKYKDTDFLYFNIDKLKNYILRDYNLSNGAIDTIRFFRDFTFITLLVGNDFVKHIPFLKFNKNLQYDGWNILLKIYIKIFQETNKYIITIKKTGLLFNTPFIKKIFLELEQLERHQLQHSQNRITHFKERENPNKGKEIVNDIKDEKYLKYKEEIADYEHQFYYSEKNPYYNKYKNIVKNTVNYYNPDYKKQYYRHFFNIISNKVNNIKKNNKANNNKANNNKNNTKVNSGTKVDTSTDKIKSITDHYIKNLIWTTQYYLCDMPSWAWYYKYRVSPFVSDIVTNLKSIKDINSFNKFDKDESFTPFQQLLLVIPPSNIDLLPDMYKPLISSTKLSKYYVSNFELDVLDGLKYIKAEAILPEINTDDIIQSTKDIDDKLNVNEKKINQLNYDPLIFEKTAKSNTKNNKVKEANVKNNKVINNKVKAVKVKDVKVKEVKKKVTIKVKKDKVIDTKVKKKTVDKKK
jgi:5'-3' exoribonuclease 1